MMEVKYGQRHSVVGRAPIRISELMHDLIKDLRYEKINAPPLFASFQLIPSEVGQVLKVLVTRSLDIQVIYTTTKLCGIHKPFEYQCLSLIKFGLSEIADSPQHEKPAVIARLSVEYVGREVPFRCPGTNPDIASVSLSPHSAQQLVLL